MPTVRAATADELPAVGRRLAAAFETDPVWRWLAPDRPHWADRAAGFYTAEAAMQHRGHGEVLVDDQLRGAALWAPPGHWKTTLAQTVRLAAPSLGLFRSGIVRGLKVLGAVESKHPRGVPHWYLAYLGTDPAHQGHGIGGALISTVTERCDTEGLGAYLESSKEENVSFYGRFGFQVRERVDLSGGPPMWLMWRDPETGP